VLGGAAGASGAPSAARCHRWSASDPPQQARTRLAAHRDTNPALRRRQAVCALRARRDQAGQPLDEGSPQARLVAAVQAPYRQLEADLAAKAG
jgi:hypothetical protein